MVFSCDMIYKDQTTPLYLKGVVYDVEDAMVSRWLKRGGEIVVEKEVTEKIHRPMKNGNRK